MIKDIEFILKKFLFGERYLLEKRLKRSIKNNYEKELKILNNFSDLSKDAVDVGVYRGTYSYELSKHFKQIHSFEPNPLIFPNLSKNLTKIIKNMKIYNYALSNDTGQAKIKIPQRTNSFFKDNVEEIYRLGLATIHENNNYENFKSFIVEKKKLDEILTHQNIGFIKIDVEGHEREVIDGSKKIIEKCKPNMLIEIEEKYSKKSVNETINYITSYGYQTFYYDNESLKKIETLNDINKENNFFFIAN